jgi:hypothetical protein
MTPELVKDWAPPGNWVTVFDTAHALAKALDEYVDGVRLPASRDDKQVLEQFAREFAAWVEAHKPTLHRHALTLLVRCAWVETTWHNECYKHVFALPWRARYPSWTAQ